VFLPNEKQGKSLSLKTWCDTNIYCSKQNKTKLKAKSKDALRKTHSAWSNKYIVSWKVTWFLPMKKGCLGGIPKLELLSILHLISSFSNPYTWKLPSYKTQHNSISNVSINIIMNQPFLVQISTQNHHIYSIYYCRNFPKSSMIKITQKESDREANTNSGRNLSKQNSWQRSNF
jgi:hypothetical protein